MLGQTAKPYAQNVESSEQPLIVQGHCLRLAKHFTAQRPSLEGR